MCSSLHYHGNCIILVLHNAGYLKEYRLVILRTFALSSLILELEEDETK